MLLGPDFRRRLGTVEGFFRVNDICCNGTHQVTEYYHLDADVQTHMEQSRAAGDCWVLKHPGCGPMYLHGSNALARETCRISKRYNQMMDSTRLVKTTLMTDRLTDWTVLTGDHILSKEIAVYQYGNSQPVSSDRVTARQFRLSEEETWIFLIWNRETFRGGKLYFCGGIPIYGKAVAIRLGKDGYVRYRLKN